VAFSTSDQQSKPGDSSDAKNRRGLPAGYSESVQRGENAWNDAPSAIPDTEVPAQSLRNNRRSSTSDEKHFSELI
jgi:hypothetical protein